MISSVVRVVGALVGEWGGDSARSGCDLHGRASEALWGWQADVAPRDLGLVHIIRRLTSGVPSAWSNPRHCPARLLQVIVFQSLSSVWQRCDQIGRGVSGRVANRFGADSCTDLSTDLTTVSGIRAAVVREAIIVPDHSAAHAGLGS